MALPRWRFAFPKVSVSTKCFSNDSRSRFPVKPPPVPRAQARADIPATPLQSRFPIKTTIFLTISSAAAYWLYQKSSLITLDYDLDPDFIQLFRNVEEVYDRLENPDFYASVHPVDAGLAQEIFNHCQQIVTNKEKDVDFPPVHIFQLGSNNPIEDELVVGSGQAPGGKGTWNYYGVFDGHAGWATSTHLKYNMIPYVMRELMPLSSDSTSLPVINAVKKAFLRLDSDIMSRAQYATHNAPALSPDVLAALAPAISGSCALLAIFDPAKSKLRVACTGDSRAVLGRYDASQGKYVAKPLSVDQTGFNELEVERITNEHPDEPDILDPKTGRLLGIAVTRAFGDSRWKWSDEFLNQIKYKFWTSQAPRPNAKTQPYMTAEPVVTETDVVRGSGSAASKGDFLILASDGLWDRISSEHAVECVQLYLESQARSEDGTVRNDPQNMRLGINSADDGFEYAVGESEISWKATPEYFVVEDDNAATHLARNAFGGSRRRLFSAVMTMLPPYSRNIRDDVTIQVIFFDRTKAFGPNSKV